MSEYRPLFPLLIFLVSLQGCAHIGPDPHYKGPATLPHALKTVFAYATKGETLKETVLKKGEKYSVKRVEIASENHPLHPYIKKDSIHRIRVDYYTVPGENVPVIMVLPILGGDNDIAGKFASHFAEKGYAGLIVHRRTLEKSDYASPDHIDAMLRQIVFDHRQVMDWIETRPELDADNIGVLGISMGGIKSTLITALDSRIKASVIMLAAGDIPYLLAYSKERGIRKRRALIMEEKEMDQDQLYEALKYAISYDPMALAQYIDADKVLMVLALFDKVAPYSKGKALQMKMGCPETVYLLSGHYTALLYIPYIKWISLRFFDRKLRVP